MPSPFPGMNPYLEHEDAWHDFHERFLPFAAAKLSSQVGENYIVKLDENIYVHELDEPRRLAGRGDVLVAELPAQNAHTSTAVLEAPATVELPDVDVEGDSFIEIRDRWTRKLVTVVELLSPANKNPGPDREQYLSKRRRIVHSSAHLVEIDLLRAGPRMPGAEALECDYCVLVSRVEDRPRAGVWPIGLRERLPEIPIPLRGEDPMPRLDLQELLHQIYDMSDYRKYIYDTTPKPTLQGEDAQWAQSLVGS